jgi:hypothetical protein
MLRQFMVGGAVSVCNIAIHALMMAIIVRVARSVGTKEWLHPSLLLIGVMSSTVSVLMVTHTVEVVVWGLAYGMVDIAAPGTNLVYFASVSLLSDCSGTWRPTSSWSGYQITRPPTQGVIAVTAVTLILSMTPLFDVAMLDTENPF